MIEVTGLHKSYGSHPAVTDVSFQVAHGEILGFLGPNGAGKSTTMRILAGCLAATSGTAKVAGYDVFEQSLEARQSLGYLPEQVPLYPEMRVEEYLRFAGSLRMLDGATLERRLTHVMGRCGLSERRHHPIARLSRGYRQRVGLAQAILHNPPVVILDEPTVGLDPKQIIEVRELIRDLAGEHTVLLSTHILPEVSMLCSRVVIIDRGRVVAEDTPQNLSHALEGDESLWLEVEGPADAVMQRLRKLPGVVEVRPDTRPGAISGVVRLQVRIEARDDAKARATRREIAAAVVQGGFGLVELATERVSLEDVFVRLITTEQRAEHSGAAR